VVDDIISIPFWSDFNPYFAIYRYTEVPISIPFWSDFNWLVVLVVDVYSRISIPFWSDFNSWEMEFSNGIKDFNPILV